MGVDAVKGMGITQTAADALESLTGATSRLSTFAAS
jgi:hypothetical protein